MQVHLAELLQRPLRRRLPPVNAATRAEERSAPVLPADAWSRVEVPPSDAAAWEDTEIDVRRLVL